MTVDATTKPVFWNSTTGKAVGGVAISAGIISVILMSVFLAGQKGQGIDAFQNFCNKVSTELPIPLMVTGAAVAAVAGLLLWNGRKNAQKEKQIQDLLEKNNTPQNQTTADSEQFTKQIEKQNKQIEEQNKKIEELTQTKTLLEEQLKGNGSPNEKKITGLVSDESNVTELVAGKGEDINFF